MGADHGDDDVARQSERRRAEAGLGPHLDVNGLPAGVRLFSNAHIDERLTTDSAGQVHFTRWHYYGRFGWKIEASLSLTAAASTALMQVMVRAAALAAGDLKKNEETGG